MTPLAIALVGVAMAVGIVGTIIPVLPGLGLVMAAGVVYAFLSGWDTVALVALAVMALLLVGGTVAKYVLADRSATRGGAPRRSLLLAALGAVIGFFVIPVIGIAVGGLGGLAFAEYQRLGDWEPARRSTIVTLRSIGTGVLVEAAAGVAMAVTWVAWVVFG